MSPVETTAGKPAPRARLGLWALCAALPVLGLGYQVAAKETALGLAHTHFGLGWFADLFRQPWAAVLIAFELVSFAAWMTVLARMRLAAAFPLTALGYVLVIGVSWAVFHEPASALQVVGGGVILAGVWMIGRGEQDAD
jgi:multidrug transporter EmrE-like cation transporter